MRSVVLVVLAGCGRIGFDPGAAGHDVTPDGNTMFAPAAGELDTTFGSGGEVITNASGIDVSGYDVLQRPGGYLVVGVRTTPSTSSIALMAYTPGGVLDTAYGAGGVVEVGGGNDFGYGALRLGPDRIIVNGDGLLQTGNNDDFVLAMIDDSGAPIASFGAAGFARLDVAGAGREDTANRVVQVGSSLIGCGISGYDITDSSFPIYRFDLTGAPVTSWGTGGLVNDDFNTNASDECTGVVALGNDVIAVGNSDERFIVVAYRETDGSRDTAFATGGYFERAGSGAFATAVAIVDGDIVAVGESNNTALIVRLGPDGMPRAGFGNAGVVVLDGVDTLDTIVAQPDGNFVVAGTFNDKPVIARLTASGTKDPTFGDAGLLQLSSMPIDVRSMTLDPDGKILITGIVTTSPLASYLARIR